MSTETLSQERMDELMEEGERYDGWANVLTGIGVAGRDNRDQAAFTRNRLTRADADEIYTGDGIGRKVIHIPVDDATKKGFEVRIDGQADVSVKVNKAMQAIDARGAVNTAAAWERAYGGSLIILLANDGLQTDQPLNENSIKGLHGLLVVDRYSISSIPQWYDDLKRDLMTGKYMRPKMYRVNLQNKGGEFDIHESRVIRLDGLKIPDRLRRQTNDSWQGSFLDLVYTKIRDVAMADSSIALALTRFYLSVFSIKDLNSLMRSKEGEKVVQKRLKLAMLHQSVLNAMVNMDGEEYKHLGVPFTGVPDVVDRVREAAAASADIPMTRLYGRSPAGMNSTGESDLANYYDNVEAMKMNKLSPIVHRIAEVVMLAYRVKDETGPTGARVPGDFTIHWEPSWQMSLKDKSEAYRNFAQGDAVYIDRGTLDPHEPRSRFEGDEFSDDLTLLEDPDLGDDDLEDDDLDADPEGAGAEEDLEEDDKTGAADGGR